MEKSDEIDAKLQDAINQYASFAKIGVNVRDLKRLKPSNDEFTLCDILEHVEQSYWTQFLKQLNSDIDAVSTIIGQKKIRDKLYANPFSAAWELEFGAYCIAKRIKLQTECPTSGNSNVDYGLVLDDSQVLVEVHARRLKKKEEAGGSADITWRFPDTIDEKIKQNAIPPNLALPWVLAIDGRYGGLDRINIQATFNQPDENTRLVSGVFLKKNGLRIHP